MAGRTLGRHAAHIAAEGRTTVQEAMRVSNQSDD
jgi:MSHA biogenesis protein MshE